MSIQFNYILLISFSLFSFRYFIYQLTLVYLLKAWRETRGKNNEI